MDQTAEHPLQPLPSQQLVTMICGSTIAQAVRTAAELRLADLVKDGPQSVAALANRTGSDAKHLSRLLRVLVGLGILSEGGPGLFGPTELSAYLQSDHPHSLSPLALLGGNWHWKALGELPLSVRTGIPAFEQVFQKDLWRYFAEGDPAIREVFNRAMAGLTSWADTRFADAYDFSSAQTLVDVGGGLGGFLMTVLRRNPTLHGILFDRPEVIEQARELVDSSEVRDRLELVAGDFFQEVPRGDVYFLRDILHNWGDEACEQILDTCQRAMLPGGSLLVAERIAGAHEAHGAQTDPMTLLFDLILMVNVRGQVRTEAEFRDLCEGIGLTITRTIAVQPYALLEVIDRYVPARLVHHQ